MKRAIVAIVAAALFACSSPSLRPLGGPESLVGDMLDLSLTQIGDDRYVDVYLAKPERDALAERFGFLVLPVHQFMMLTRDGDELRVTSFKGRWLQEASAANGFAMEVMPIGGHEIGVITADSGTLTEFLRTHAHDPGATTGPMVFHRLPG